MFVFKAKRTPRFTDAVPKIPAARIPFLDVHRAADLKVLELSRLFENAFITLRRKTSVNMLADIMERGELGRIDLAIKELERRRPELEKLVSGIVADSGNRASKEFARRSGVVGSFNVTNQRAVDWAANKSSELIVQVGNETKRAIRAEIARSFREGIPVPKAARNIRPLVGLTRSQWSSVVRMREALLEGGIVAAKVEERAVKFAAKLHRRRALLIARTECLPAETLVDGAVVSAAFRRRYSGDIVQVKTRRGREFTTTPNHPMLTVRGWRSSGQLSIGDNLICNHGQKGFVPSGNQNVQAGPATIGEVFDSVSAIGTHERRDGVGPDFHGDGRNGDVDIFRADRELRFGLFASLTEPVVDGLLSGSNKSRFCFCNFCQRLLPINESLCLCGGSLDHSGFAEALGYCAVGYFIDACQTAHGTSRGIGLSNFGYWEAPDIIWALSAVLEKQASGLGEGSGYAGLLDYLTDPFRIGVQFPGDSFNAEAASIETDCVISVSLRSFSGHVYNLSTPDGYYTINDGLYTGNTIASANYGQQEFWLQAVDDGLVPKTARRKWIVTPDDRLEPLCEALRGVTAGMNEAFRGGVMNPPLHPGCRCTTGLVLS